MKKKSSTRVPYAATKKSTENTHPPSYLEREGAPHGETPPYGRSVDSPDSTYGMRHMRPATPVPKGGVPSDIPISLILIARTSFHRSSEVATWPGHSDDVRSSSPSLNRTSRIAESINFSIHPRSDSQ